MRSILCLAFLLAACSGPAVEEPAPELPDLSGNYSLVFAPANTGCLPPDYPLDAVFGFLDEGENSTWLTTASFAQNGVELAVTLDSNDCVLDGALGEDGNFTVRGPCDDVAMNREISVRGDPTRSGMNGWWIDGTASFDVDSGDGSGGGPDGVVDCVVTEVNVTGSGAPVD